MTGGTCATACRRKRRGTSCGPTAPSSCGTCSCASGGGRTPGTGPGWAGNWWPPCCEGLGVGTGQDLQEVPVRVLEVDAPAAPSGVDLALPALVRVGPVRHAPRGDAPEDLVELGVTDQEGVVLRRDAALGVHEVEAHAVGRLHHLEAHGVGGSGKPEELRHEDCRCLAFAGVDDGV